MQAENDRRMIGGRVGVLAQTWLQILSQTRSITLRLMKTVV